jgi:hypothetical protein
LRVLAFSHDQDPKQTKQSGAAVGWRHASAADSPNNASCTD